MRPRLGARDRDADVSSMHSLVALTPALLVSLRCCPTLLSSDSWEHLPGACEPDFFTALSFCSSPFLSPSVNSAFQALPQQISLASFAERHRPLHCDRSFCMLAAHFELCSGTFVGLLCFPLPPQGHPQPQPLIPHPCRARRDRAAAQTGRVLVLCLWGALLTTTVTPLTPPAAPAEQRRQAPGRGGLLCSVHGACHGPPPCLPAEYGGDFPTALCSSGQPGGCR